MIYQSGSTTEDVKSISSTSVLFYGAPGIIFHDYIEKDGTLVRCNPYTNIIKDLSDGNNNSINVCLSGDFDKESPTIEQLKTLLYVLETQINNELVPGTLLTLNGYKGSNPYYLGGTLYSKILDLQLPSNYSLSVLY